MAKTSKIKRFNWNIFAQKVTELLKFASGATAAPINAERWEEIIFHALKSMGMKYKGEDPRWITGSHAPGADIWVDGLSISAKAGKLNNDKFLTISSYRLTRFSNLEQMKAFIDKEASNFDVYLCCARADQKGKRVYQVFLIPANVFSAQSLSWSKTTSGWQGSNNDGIIVKIVKKMSNQLWVTLPVHLCKKIAEVKLPVGDLGLELSDALNLDKKD